MYKTLNICIHIVAFTYQTVNLFFPKIADEQLTEKNPFSRRKIVRYVTMIYNLIDDNLS